jgi:hypothetical protein
MKRVREILYEDNQMDYINFTEDNSDPISDMKIGVKNRVEVWLNSNDIKNYKLTKRFAVNVYENVIIENTDLESLPEYLKFNHISGGFHIKHNLLTSLKGFPYSITGSFVVSYNKLKNLKDGPFIVKDIYSAGNNLLESLEGISQYVGNSLYLHNNNLKNLKHIPKLIKGDLNIKDNPIETIEYFPDEIEGNLYFTPSNILNANTIRKRCEVEGFLLV